MQNPKGSAKETREFFINAAVCFALSLESAPKSVYARSCVCHHVPAQTTTTSTATTKLQHQGMECEGILFISI